MQKTPWHSYKTGKLARGCELCVQGRKLVLFITGICSRKCWYCPISEHKFGKDVVYANEWKIKDPENPVELLEEARLTGAKGAGITGGDPLCKTDRCVKYINLLKKKFGKQFHIHLYTPLNLVTEENLKKLCAAGLDEIRFHPDIDDDKLWDRINLAAKYKWNVGVEIPLVPDKELQTKKLIDYIAGKVKFVNLNELERSDTAAKHYKLDAKGYTQKNRISYGIKGSTEMGQKILQYAENKGLNAHLCTAKLKDAVQMAKRIKLRAKSVAQPFDKITKEGLLLRGACYLPGLQPGSKPKTKDTTKKLKELSECIIDTIGLDRDGIAIDEKRHRILMSQKQIKQNSEQLKKIGLIPALVEEYPTEDATIVEIEFV